MTNYFGKLQVGEFKLESYDLKVGEEVMIVGPNTGVVQMIVPELRLELAPVEQVGKGAIFSMPCERNCEGLINCTSWWIRRRVDAIKNADC